MLDMRDQMMHMRDDMSPEDVEHMRREMQEHMRHAPFGGRCRPDFDNRRGEHGHGHRPDFRNNFWFGK